jgi:hypothetical protein
VRGGLTRRQPLPCTEAEGEMGRGTVAQLGRVAKEEGGLLSDGDKGRRSRRDVGARRKQRGAVGGRRRRRRPHGAGAGAGSSWRWEGGRHARGPAWTERKMGRVQNNSNLFVLFNQNKFKKA